VKNVFYKPAGAFAGDFIPFYKDGLFRLFYLLDWRDKDNHGEGTPWYQITTRDFVGFAEHGEMVPRGTEKDQDLYVFTGSLLEAQRIYHIFYTGHNPYFPKQGKPQQAVMHAVSNDLLRWKKVPEDTFFAPSGSDSLYEPHDWRDPFVFYNDQAQEYWMLLAARLKTGSSRRRGCIALCTSRDLKSWSVRDPFWAPGLYYMHECPDLFKMGDWWYLVYSTFSERYVTHYRMSKNLKGPWKAPENDTFDGRAFYAAKTWSDGKKRYAFGWNPTREEESDRGTWQWGGNLVVHEIVQEIDGYLVVQVPGTVDILFSIPMEMDVIPRKGAWKVNDGVLTAEAPDSFAYALAGKLPAQCKISGTITFGPNTRGCGIMVNADKDGESSYYIRIEPGRDRLVLDVWPRKGDLPFMVELERPIKLIPDKSYDITIFLDGSICVVYLGRKIAMNARLYDLKEDGWGLFVNEGSAKFDGFSVMTISPSTDGVSNISRFGLELI